MLLSPCPIPWHASSSCFQPCRNTWLCTSEQARHFDYVWRCVNRYISVWTTDRYGAFPLLCFCVHSPASPKHSLRASQCTQKPRAGKHTGRKAPTLTVKWDGLEEQCCGLSDRVGDSSPCRTVKLLGGAWAASSRPAGLQFRAAAYIWAVPVGLIASLMKSGNFVQKAIQETVKTLFGHQHQASDFWISNLFFKSWHCLMWPSDAPVCLDLKLVGLWQVFSWGCPKSLENGRLYWSLHKEMFFSSRAVSSLMPSSQPNMTPLTYICIM